MSSCPPPSTFQKQLKIRTPQKKKLLGVFKPLYSEVNEICIYSDSNCLTVGRQESDIIVPDVDNTILFHKKRAKNIGVVSGPRL